MNHSKKGLSEKVSKGNPQRGERGYALIALIGVMMFALILTTAAAPQVKKETQREREEEMLWRGQQVASAIALYYKENGRFPLGEKGMRELVEGIQSASQIGAKKKKYLRPSALCDPMTPCASGTINWRLVRPGDSLAGELYEAYNAWLLKVRLGGEAWS